MDGEGEMSVYWICLLKSYSFPSENWWTRRLIEIHGIFSDVVVHGVAIDCEEAHHD